jgi:hypothetical protein
MPRFGKIIYGRKFTSSRVQIGLLVNEAKEIIRGIKDLKHTQNPPKLLLNTHCQVCEFHKHCHAAAVEKDDLSLLRGLTEKEISKLNNKGIFTVTQYSYTFRPRRRRRKRPRKPSPKHDCSLQALALRTHTIYVAKKNELRFTTPRLYLDIEGIPEENFYYLIGLLIADGSTPRYHHFWADNRIDESRIWKSFLATISKIGDFTLFHYGSFESKYFQRMYRLYGGNSTLFDKLISNSNNVLSSIYAHVYFPTHSNDLKSIANYLGFKWSAKNASGIQSIVWRHQWEETKDDTVKQKLIKYNHEDCVALHLVTNTLESISANSDQNGNDGQRPIVHTNDIQREYPLIFKRNDFLFPELERINQCAYFDYQRTRVYLRTSVATQRSIKRKERNSQKTHKINKETYCARPVCCRFCRSTNLIKHGRISKVVYDLKMFNGGIKRWIVRYRSDRYLCGKCRKTFVPDNYRTVASSKYGYTLVAWTVYQNIALLLSHGTIDEGLRELFGYYFPNSTVSRFKIGAADYYKATYHHLAEGLRRGSIIHADETRVSIKGKTCYVWIFTNLEVIIYTFSETREGNILKEVLNGFQGVLISDFYTAYDSVECIQQKCLIHLIRDINDDLFKNPFDDELNEFGRDFTMLLSPIIETIDKYGLKKWHLNKHKLRVRRFIEKVMNHKYKSDLAKSYKRRIIKYSDKLFTFLDYDGVPWNNNNAEHAIKRLACLRRVIGGSSTTDGIQQYLVLLSICETLKLRNVSFLRFLVSGTVDIDKFVGNES